MIVYYIGMLAAPLEEIRGQAKQFQEATRGRQPGRRASALRRPPSLTQASWKLGRGPLRVEFEGRVVSGIAERSAERWRERPIASMVLADISFTLAPGRVLGVLGRTGSGKTTLTRLLFRLYDPAAGAIRLDGADLRDCPFDVLRARSGW